LRKFLSLPSGHLIHAKLLGYKLGWFEPALLRKIGNERKCASVEEKSLVKYCENIVAERTMTKDMRSEQKSIALFLPLIFPGRRNQESLVKIVQWIFPLS
jgi:hypothetical protein